VGPALVAALVPGSGTALAVCPQGSDWRRAERAELLAHRVMPAAESLRVRAYGTEEGLPSMAVRALEFGPDGALWVGTLGGLCRFDGADFERLPLPGQGELGATRIESLHRDAGGRIWIGTFASGVWVFEDGRFLQAAPTGVIRRVGKILSTPDGAVWMAGSQAAVAVEGEVRALDLGRRPDGRPPQVLDVDVLDDGRVRLDTSAGVMTGGVDGVELESERVVTGRVTDAAGRALERRSGDWFDSRTGEPVDLGGLGRVLDHRNCGDDAVAVAGQNGLFVLRGSGPEMRVEHVDHGIRPRLFLGDGGGGLFMATRHSGLLSVAPQPFRLVKLAGEEPLTVASVAVDGEGRVMAAVPVLKRAWIGDGRTWQEFGSTHRSVRRQVERCGSGGFFVLERDRLVIERGDELELFALPGEPALAGPGGIGNAPALLEGADGGAWLWMEGSLLEFDRDGAPGRRIDGVSRRPFDGLADGDGTIVLLPEAVAFVGPGDTELRVLLELPGVVPRAAMRDADGALWIATYGDGIHRLRPDGSLDRWTTRDGLANDMLGWIGAARAADGTECIWVNSNAGVLAIERASLDAVAGGRRDHLATWRIGTPEGDGASGAVGPDGALYLPSLEGLVRIEPGRVSKPPDPSVTVGLVMVDGVCIEDAPALAGADLAVQFSGVSLPSGEGARFQYRLLGLDDAWVDAGRSRVARYPNLPRGDYVFEVRGRSSTSDWSDPVAALGGRPITVSPRWHQRRDLRFAAALGLLLLAAGAVRLRTRVLRRRARWMEDEIDRRRAVEEELARNEERFRTLFRTIPTPVLVWDASLELIDWNDSAARVLGLSDAPDASHRLEDVVVAGADRDEFLRAAAEVSASDDRAFARCIVRNADGDERHFRWAFGPLHGGRAESRAVIALGADVTDEERTAAHLDELRRQVVRAEEVERGRIARELHDDLSQRLAALAMDLAGVSRGIATGEDLDADTLRALSSVEGGVRDVAHDMHSLSRKLHPTVLDDLGLARALQSEAERRSRQHGVRIRIDDRTNGAELDRDVALTFFRVAQEALQNACKHADANAIDVRLLTGEGGQVMLVVEDDGVGFDGTSVAGRGGTGIGLASMTERARLVGGRLHVESSPGGGTRVVLSAGA